MQASGKVIMFKTSGTIPHHSAITDETPIENFESAEGAGLLEKALKVLDDIEEKWEVNHSDLDLRDNFHLMRHYLKRLRHT
jgi:hypothetical protein